MKSLKFTIPVLLAVCLVFSWQCLMKSAAIDAAGRNIYSPATNNLLARDGAVNAGSASLQTAAVKPVVLIRDNDTYFNRQWGLPAINLPPFPELSSLARHPVRVAVLDTGIDRNQEDLRDKVIDEINFSQSPTVNDINGHGTAVAGIIAANTDNDLGIAGVDSFCQLLNVKVADDSGDVKAKTVAQGIIWAVKNGASVINISIEFPKPSPELEEAVNYAWEQGAVVVAAASNHTINPVYPAYYANCIAVAPENQQGLVGPLLYNKSWVDVAAPGYSIYSTLPDNKYGYNNGTSFAVAYVSGLAALLSDISVDQNGSLRINEEVRNAIETTARITPGNSIKIIDAASSIAQIKALSSGIYASH